MQLRWPIAARLATNIASMDAIISRERLSPEARDGQVRMTAALTKIRNDMGDLIGPFLTDLDSRAQVKGSRDPLGAQSVWTRFGRHVVGNLTTVTNSVRDFTTLLPGYYFAERVAADLGPGSELSTFLKWEQLAGYARAYVNKDYAFRGTERVQGTLNAGTRVTLSKARAFQILSDQQTYGLWGLYSVASAAAGLVDQDPARLTPSGLEFVERFYLPVFHEAGIPNADRVVELLSRVEARIELAKAEHKLCATVAQILKRRILEREREFYHSHLVEGGPSDSTQGRQALLAKIMEGHIQERVVWSPALLRAFEKEAMAAGVEGEQLVQSGRCGRAAAATRKAGARQAACRHVPARAAQGAPQSVVHTCAS
jgi:hypothetical protein